MKKKEVIIIFGGNLVIWKKWEKNRKYKSGNIYYDGVIKWGVNIELR